LEQATGIILRNKGDDNSILPNQYHQ
jgi:hypothetical protein